ncbi:MAG: glycosyltransferase family 25 protein [Phenylobacterium sp.]
MKPCVFINLEAARDRRASVEASFAAAAPQGWRLERFAALGPADVAAISGSLRPAEKACFASHRAVIGERLGDADPLFVVEDDAIFSPRAFSVLEALLAADPAWDVLFADLALCDLSLMIQLAKRRDALAARGEHLALNLAGRSFTGAAAYVVRGSVKRRLYDALSAPAALDQPYDLFLRDLCHAGTFRMGVAFPFLTAASSLADDSQIQTGDGAVFDATLGAFRRLMYVDRDLDQCRRDTERLTAAHTDEAARMVGAVFASAAPERKFKGDTNIFRVLIKTLPKAGLITARMRSFYAA